MTLIKKASRILILRGFLFFTPLYILLSCANVSPINSIREGVSVFSCCEDVQPQWQRFEEGIDFFHGKIASPRIEFWALQIDLAAPDISVVVKDAADGGLSAKVSSFVRDNELIAGINAVPFDVVSSREGRPIKNSGLVISGGKLLSPANPRYDAIVFYKDRSAAIVNQSTIHITENTENAAGGFHQILAGREPAERTFNREERHPRSAAGIAADGSRLYLLVIDGRRKSSAGATEKETAVILSALGAEDGLNLDGGGSATLALRGKDGKVTIANTPIHNNIPGLERAVAGCIGVKKNP